MMNRRYTSSKSKLKYSLHRKNCAKLSVRFQNHTLSVIRYINITVICGFFNDGINR